jgi:CxxC motif-containing protein (DUF1111 family)
MMYLPRSNGRSSWVRFLPCAVLLGACGSGSLDNAAGAAPNTGAHERDANANEIDGGVEPRLPSSAVCGERELPQAFVNRCSACHSSTDSQSPRYPDLFAFAGTARELIAQVRQGGESMPAFSAADISDEDLERVFAFFRDRPREQVDLGSVQPLFAEPVAAVPITFMRDDGVLVTRAAGRVRQRHELERTFGPFGAHYFEHRSYGFIIEDFTPRGESRIRVTYLPLTMPESNTNFRAWKIYENGNVFHSNLGMDQDAELPSMTLGGRSLTREYAADVAPFAFAQSQETTRNARENRDIQEGDLFEFEFGVFIDEAAVRPGTRTSYYTDTFRYQVGIGGLTPDNRDSAGLQGPELRAQQGGGTTGAWLYAEPETSFEQLALNVQHEHVQTFLEGRRLFHTDFETGEHSEAGNPRFDAQAGKAGPLLVATTCAGCHDRNGGGRPLDGEMNRMSSMAIKLYDAAELGNQLQLGEGRARLTETVTKTVVLADGTEVQLARGVFAATATDGRALHHSARIARRIVGMGLLEALSETSLLARADPRDCDQDGISGRASLVADPASSDLRMGRFGWRAEKVSVAHQVADAAAADLGVFSELIKGPTGEVELSNEELRKLTTYMRLLGVPAQRDGENAEVRRGEKLFKTIGCASCHTSDAVTGPNHPFVELREQVINPYSDLLLHDMGPDLADASGEAGDREDGEAPSASEWRTAPLWGVGIASVVQGYTALLHDGRARSVLEAVLWHGGEAESVRKRVEMLSSEDRAALVRFLESL